MPGAGSLLKKALKNPGPAQSGTSYGDALFFVQFVRPLWKTGALSIVLTVMTTALGSLLPLGGKVLIDFIVMKKDHVNLEHFPWPHAFESLIVPLRHSLGSLNLLILTVLFAGAAFALLGIMQRFLMFRFQQELSYNLQIALFDRILRFPLSFFRKKQTGYIMARVSDDVHALQILFSESISVVASKILYLLFSIAIVFTLSTKLALISLSLLPVYILINFFYAGRVRTASLNAREAGASVSTDLQEVISGVETVKAHSAEARESSKVALKMKSAVQTRMHGMLLNLLSNYSAASAQFFFMLVIVWAGAGETDRGTLTIGDYLAVVSYMFYLTNSLNGLALFHIMLQPVFVSLSRLLEIFRLVPEFEDKEKYGEIIGPGKVRGEISFRDVSFSYEEGRPVLKNVSFSARPGEIIALVGPSGAGKTTLINLLLKFFSPESGSITFDGRDLKALSTRWLRGQIGVVSQDAFLFDDTIDKNIRYGNPLASSEDVIQASQWADIHDAIEALPDKYLTKTGERGMRLSAGQRQKISLARAFLKKPAILVLDEPTSALDPESEAKLKDSFRKCARDTTTFIITHRLSTIDIADRILVLINGEITE